MLAGGGAAALATEAAHRAHGSTAWVLVGAIASALALLFAWRKQERLRLGLVLVISVALLVGFLAVHLALGVLGDKDARVVFRWQGNTLLRGEYPRSEYPVGAVVLFALEAWLGGGATRVTNALTMLPFHVATVAAVAATRTPYAPWLAALVGTWPLNAFYWEYKFDLAPAAFLAVGAVLALRERWALAGVALGAGTLVKWTPALAAAAFVVWLIASRRVRDAALHAGATVATVGLVYVPFLLWRASEVAAAYTRQTGRAVTPESAWYLLLRPLDLAHVRTHISFSAGAPRWANVAAAILQAAAVLLVLSLCTRVRGTTRAAVAIAVLVPVVFLLTNRIFSPQFVLVLFAAWGVAGGLLARTRGEQLAIGMAMAAVASANAFVYPYALPYYDVTWVVASATLFAGGLGLTAALALRATRPAA